MPNLITSRAQQRDNVLAVTEIPLDSLTPDPRNPRRHDRRHVRQIARSIETFGFNAPVLIDAGGQIIAGHGRIESARLLGRTSVPTIELGHLSPEQQTAYLLADNKLTDLSTWDSTLLAEVLRDLSAVDLAFDLEATGFSVAEIDLGIALVDVGRDDPADTPVAAATPAIECG
jgi:ParB-like chromosome segregation protein Spo0J